MSTAAAVRGTRSAAEDQNQPLLEVQGLHLEFPTYWGVTRALNGVDLALRRGEIAGLVGESGCGKSVTAMAVMRLLPEGHYRVPQGRILFRGEDLLARDEQGMQRIRGQHISMIFQEPMTSLNPTIRVGRQIAEVIQSHQDVTRSAATARAADLLREMRIPDAERVAGLYPHELSGGMRQRSMIAMALSCEPDLLIADEPTTALDVTVQAQVLALLKQKCVERRTAVLLITHDLGVVANVCRQVAVMYAGNVVETGPVDEVLASPRHPYTAALLETIPERFHRDERLRVIPGSVPSLLHPPPGCRFHPRCAAAAPRCARERPPVFWSTSVCAGGDRHGAACWLLEDRDGNCGWEECSP
ncbi:MAG: ABC transporter ATP-binding protein [Bacillota bacterium]|nr:ABC transporter ATP-binding protein [Bacillota bacterium]